MLRRATPLRRHKRLAQMSKKRKAERLIREVTMDAVRARDERCQAYGKLPGRCAGPLDGHEPLSRARGGDPLDPDQVILLCRAHHDAAHRNPTLATQLGFLRPSWQGTDLDPNRRIPSDEEQAKTEPGSSEAVRNALLRARRTPYEDI